MLLVHYIQFLDDKILLIPNQLSAAIQYNIINELLLALDNSLLVYSPCVPQNLSLRCEAIQTN